MRKMLSALGMVFILLTVSAEVKNADKPLKGEWDFQLQKVWETDNVEGMAFKRPSELRATLDEVLCFHDFGHKMSCVFDRDGKFVRAFAKQGTGPGEVDRYINCFIAGDRIVVGTPGRLHFYSRQGNFIESFENNLFFTLKKMYKHTI